MYGKSRIRIMGKRGGEQQREKMGGGGGGVLSGINCLLNE